jgi:hypothetical protein
MTQLLDHALKYAAFGWHVHPIVPRQKIPLTKHGVKDATTDADQIRAWWTKWPDANIAVACGKGSGVYVVDIDVEQATSVDGYESLKEFPPLPETVRQGTPRGGFHAFYRATDPPGNRNSFRPGIDIRGDGYYVLLPPSIHPNGKQYFWAEGCGPDEIELADFPDFMRPTVKAPWTDCLNKYANVSKEELAEKMKAAAKKMVFSPPLPLPDDTAPPVTFKGVPITFNYMLPGLSDDEKKRRASLYLAEVEPATQGQDGHGKLLWASVALVHGFLLTDDQALDLLIREYNPRCIPPWNLDDPKDAKDFRRKVTEARKLTPKEQPGYLLNDPAYAPIDTIPVDIKKLIENSHAAELKEITPPNAKLLELTEQFPAPQEWCDSELQFLTQPTGLLGEICAWVNATAIRKQPFLALACSLAFCGVLFGRKIRDELGNFTNLYCMGIAQSSAGKTKVLSQIRRLCMAAGCTDLLGGDDFASDSAIEKRMSIRPATLFLCDEIGHLFSRIKSATNQHTAKIVPLLMKLYSAAGDVYLGREYSEDDKQRTIVQPCCCIYGASTPERFVDGVTTEELQDGWLSRCLVFRAGEQKPQKTRGAFGASIPTSIVERVRAWFLRENAPQTDGGDITQFAIGSSASMITAPPKQLIIPTDSRAEQMFVDFDNEATAIGKEQPQCDSLWGKAEENARKISVILAASESFDSPRITPAIADYAIRLIRYLLKDFRTNVVTAITTNQTDTQKQKLLTIIGKQGVKGCLKSFLTNRSPWANQRERNALLADLIEAEKITCQATESGKGAMYWTVDNYRALLAKREK